MKKTLLLSTALVAFAGMAAADIALSGRAEMGVFGSDADDDDMDFFTDIDVTFTMSGETDGGLSFGASVDLDEGGDGSPASDDNNEAGGATIFISGGFGTLTMGDTDGALDWALVDAGNINNGGSIADDETEHGGYLGAYLDGFYDNQVVRYDYSFGDFGVAISAEMDDSDTDDDRDTGYAIGGRWSGDLGGVTVNAGLGYQQAEFNLSSFLGTDLDNSAAVAFDETNPTVPATAEAFFRGDASIIGVSLGADFGNGFAAGLTYTDWDFDFDADALDDVDSGTHVGIGAGYITGALTLHANYGQYDIDDFGTVDGYGLSAAYDLGGGAVLHAGYGHTSVDLDSDVGDDPDDLGTYSFGLGLSF